MQKIKILMADDNRMFTDVLSEFISEQHDMEVASVVHNGRDVLREIEQNRDVPDVLLLDLIMPHLDGLGVLEHLREINCLQPCCMTQLGVYPAISFGGAKGKKEPTAKWTILA